mmetsp:Transcript_46471/g.76641  ORF Transcript_46471/g.76641 Transcript_46471/m.76641 type:complete len:163 (+) Transcript_46471:89-577(+)
MFLQLEVDSARTPLPMSAFRHWHSLRVAKEDSWAAPGLTLSSTDLMHLSILAQDIQRETFKRWTRAALLIALTGMVSASSVIRSGLLMLAQFLVQLLERKQQRRLTWDDKRLLNCYRIEDAFARIFPERWPMLDKCCAQQAEDSSPWHFSHKATSKMHHTNS